MTQGFPDTPEDPLQAINSSDGKANLWKAGNQKSASVSPGLGEEVPTGTFHRLACFFSTDFLLRIFLW